MQPALERIFKPAEPGLSTELARYVLTLGFTADEKARANELGYKAQDGTLTPAEQAELDELITAGDLLAILKAKARQSLVSSAA